MNKPECLCIVLTDFSNPNKGKLSILNFYTGGLIEKILNKYKDLNSEIEKILIKNNFNCFLPEMILFYIRKGNSKDVKREIKKDMKNLKIKKYWIIG